tara:strand:- start:18978 stop:19553 length:576 start_codon:yes stop_codon:yes gene_type:complete
MRNSRKMKTIKLLAILFISTLTFTACNDEEDHDDHDDHDHEEELITTATYTLTDGTNTITLTFQDLDGEGGNPGTTTVSGPLMANTTYTGSMSLLNETESPAEDITTEVQAESAEHEFFYTTTVSGLTITKTDQDSNGDPFGLATSLTTTGAGTGTITIVLKHEPTKPNNGTAAGAGGETDIEVTFNVTVQ